MSTRGADPTPGSTSTVQTHSTGDKLMKTEYVVLEQTELGQWIQQPDTIFSTGGNAALKKHLDAGKGKKATALVAVPARSWQPVKPKTTTKTITSLEPII
jgi:hypothetical protein